MTGRRIVVGGHSRGVGKTALVVALVRALAPRPVATVKVSAHRHGDGRVAIEEDVAADPATSTGRCLAAGAARAFLCRCPDGCLHEVAALVGLLAAGGCDVVVESNRLAPLVDADLTFFAVSSHTDDWKPSSSLCLSRADALVLAPGTATLPRARRGGLPRRGSVRVLRFDAQWGVPGLARWVTLVSPSIGRPGSTPDPVAFLVAAAQPATHDGRHVPGRGAAYRMAACRTPGETTSPV